jgi:hypothetical protein
MIINYESVKVDRRVSLRVFIEVGKDSFSMSESNSESPCCQAEERGVKGAGIRGVECAGKVSRKEGEKRSTQPERVLGETPVERRDEGQVPYCLQKSRAMV